MGRVIGRAVMVHVIYMKYESTYLSGARSETEQDHASQKQTLDSVSPKITTLATFFEKSYRGKKEQIKISEILKILK